MRSCCAAGCRRVYRRVDGVRAGRGVRVGVVRGRQPGVGARRHRRRAWRAPSTPTRARSSVPSTARSPTAAQVAMEAAEVASGCGRAAIAPHEAGAPLTRSGGGLGHTRARPRAALSRPLCGPAACPAEVAVAAARLDFAVCSCESAEAGAAALVDMEEECQGYRGSACRPQHVRRVERRARRRKSTGRAHGHEGRHRERKMIMPAAKLGRVIASLCPTHPKMRFVCRARAPRS
jgi:hypothetical protein